jgi:DNA-binding CsgD family transcriptional regulator
VATGEPAEALALLESQGVMDGPPPEIMLLPCPRVVRAECLAAAGQLEQGVNELLQALAWLDEQQEPSPGAWHFPATLVDGLLALGRRDEAAERAGAWLGRTSAFGANTTTGMAQRAVALCRAGDERLDGLKVAEATLSQCPSQFEHARALVELGAALRRAGRRLDAREPLRRGLDLASRCGAKALAGRAQEELVAAGARPRRVALTGVEALSPSELRVAQLAAQGFTNRQVATALFLSRKTVEHHLGSIYTKLGTNDRRRLKVLIGQPSPA